MFFEKTHQRIDALSITTKKTCVSRAQRDLLHDCISASMNLTFNQRKSATISSSDAEKCSLLSWINKKGSHWRLNILLKTRSKTQSWKPRERKQKSTTKDHRQPWRVFNAQTKLSFKRHSSDRWLHFSRADPCWFDTMDVGICCFVVEWKDKQNLDILNKTFKLLPWF